jgi:hypothetical protein
MFTLVVFDPVVNRWLGLNVYAYLCQRFILMNKSFVFRSQLQHKVPIKVTEINVKYIMNRY